MRRAWMLVASFSSWTASRALPQARPASARVRTAAALVSASGVGVNPASSASAAKTRASWAGRAGKLMTAGYRAASAGRMRSSSGPAFPPA
jgi:hypothetical protein